MGCHRSKLASAIKITMSTKNAKKVAEQTANITRARTKLAPTGKFAGYTLAQYTAAVQDSGDARELIADLRTQLKAALDNRADADNQTRRINELVVNAVKGDPNYGSDSDLYDTMGFVRKSARKSGLTRGSKGNTPVPKNNPAN